MITTEGAEARGVGALGGEKIGLELRSSARLRTLRSLRSIRCERSIRISCCREFSRARLISVVLGEAEFIGFCGVLSTTARLRPDEELGVGATAVGLEAGRCGGLLQTE